LVERPTRAVFRLTSQGRGLWLTGADAATTPALSLVAADLALETGPVVRPVPTSSVAGIRCAPGSGLGFRLARAGMPAFQWSGGLRPVHDSRLGRRVACMWFDIRTCGGAQHPHESAHESGRRLVLVGREVFGVDSFELTPDGVEF